MSKSQDSTPDIVHEDIVETTYTGEGEPVYNPPTPEFPEAQWTIMWGKSPSENWTVRGSYEAVKAIRSRIMADLEEEQALADPIMAVTAPQGGYGGNFNAPQPASNCPQCGSPMQHKQGKNKNGKFYKGNFCTNKQCGNVIWG